MPTLIQLAVAGKGRGVAGGGCTGLVLLLLYLLQQHAVEQIPQLFGRFAGWFWGHGCIDHQSQDMCFLGVAGQRFLECAPRQGAMLV